MPKEKLNCKEAFLETLSNNQYIDFWKNYARLTGNFNPTTLNTRTNIDKLIDKSTCFDNEIIGKAFEFFLEYVWLVISNNEIK